MAKFEKRHLEFVASVIRSLDIDPEKRTKVAEEFAKQLTRTNPKFKLDVFLKASGAA